VVEGKIPCVNFVVSGPYSKGQKQNEDAGIDEIIACSEAVDLIRVREPGAVFPAYPFFCLVLYSCRSGEKMGGC